MSQILLIESDESLRTILKLNIMKNIGGDVIEKDSASSAISLLQILPDVDLIICREQIGSEKSGLMVSQFLAKENYSTPLLVIGNKISDYKHLITIDSNQSWKNIISATGKILGVDVVFDENKVISVYVPVGVHYFLNITSFNLGCDIYIRVKKSENEFQYIKRLHSGDHFTREDIEKYQESGLKDFYISKDHFSGFVNFVTSKLTEKLKDPAISGEKLIRLEAEAYEVTLDRIHSLGIDDYTIELVEESVKSMENSLKDNNALLNFLQSLRANKLSYAYAHSFLSSLILHKIVNYFDWESTQVKEKLTYVAYFHDISLHNSNLMKINNPTDLKDGNLSEEEKKIILNHARESANIIERFPQIPNGIGTILMEHHGSKSGIGFPETLSISIAPLSMMFVVVEHFVDEFLKIQGTPKNEDFEKIFMRFHRVYNKVTYQQTLQALEKMILKKNKQAN